MPGVQWRMLFIDASALDTVYFVLEDPLSSKLIMALPTKACNSSRTLKLYAQNPPGDRWSLTLHPNSGHTAAWSDTMWGFVRCSSNVTWEAQRLGERHWVASAASVESRCYGDPLGSDAHLRNALGLGRHLRGFQWLSMIFHVGTHWLVVISS